MTGESKPSWSGFLPAFARRSLNVANQAASHIDTIAAVKNLPAPAPVFIVGLPRSGTTLAYELLVQAFDVAYLTRSYSYTYGMPNLTTRLVAPFTRHPKPRYSSDYGRIPGLFAPAENAVLWTKWFGEHPVLGHYLPNSLVTEASASDVTAMVASMSTIAKRPFVFKNVYQTLSLSAILESLPTSRVIVVSRDIDAITASVFNKRRTLTTPSWWSIRPPFVEEVLLDGTVGQTAFQCIRSKQILDRELRLVDQDRCMVIDYSDICRAPADFIDSVARWAGSDLRRRADNHIPQRFDVRPSVGYPADVAGRFSNQFEALASSRDQYLRRIDEYVAQQAAIDR